MNSIFGSIKVLFKFIIFVFLVLSFLSYSFFVGLIYKDIVKRRHCYTKGVAWACGWMIYFMNAKINVRGMPDKSKSHLIVSNHLGMIDILAISSLRPCLFITSVDMRETPFLGQLAEASGCLFVERRNRSNISNEILVIREALAQGFNVVLFPEATSTNGEKVIPFKKTLMTAAAGTGVPILPLCLNYRKVNGEPNSLKWRDHVFWYGDIPFIDAFKRHFALNSIELDMDFLNEIICHTEEDRRIVSQTAQDQIVAHYTPIVR
jgi:lyso-ornithine lipid O-acyltransferase